MDIEIFFNFLEQRTFLFYTLVTLLGLIIGSFLNVVVHRVPIMMEQQWAAEAKYIVALLDKGLSLIKPSISQDIETPHNQNTTDEAKAEHFNLILPHSHCPTCKKSIKASQNIPILSYCILRGKCAACATPISIRYPSVELATALLSLWVAMHFGVNWETVGALILTWSLIPLTLIDFDTQLLPDSILFPLLWCGLGLNIFGLFTPLSEAVIGALAGYLSLWSVFWVFKLATGKEGMGYGDFKLLSALGAWLGYKAILPIILLSSFAGAAIGISLILFKGRDKQKPMAFGPYLALGGWLTLLYQDQLLTFIF